MQMDNQLQTNARMKYCILVLMVMFVLLTGYTEAEMSSDQLTETNLAGITQPTDQALLTLEQIKLAFQNEGLQLTEMNVPSEISQSATIDNPSPTAIYKLNTQKLITVYSFNSLEEATLGLR